MKKYVTEVIVLLIQLFMFYIFPLFAGPTDVMGMVLLIVAATFILGFILGIMSSNKIKFLYPIGIAVLFIPGVWIYYNSSALIHSVWYLVLSFVGLLVGSIIKKLVNK